MITDETLSAEATYAMAGVYVLKGKSMTDEKTKVGGQDRQRIIVNEPYELRDWAARFGVSEDALRRAVDRVGDRVDDVQRELGGRR